MLFALDVAAKGLLVLTIALASVIALRRRSAATRYLIWSTAIGCLLLLPALVLLVPALELPLVPVAWLAPPEAAPGPAAVVPTVSRAIAPRPSPRAPIYVETEPSRDPMAGSSGAPDARSSSPASEPRRQVSTPSLQGQAWRGQFAMPAWPTLLAGIYLLGVLALFAYVAVGVRRVLRNLYEARTVTDAGMLDAFERARLQLGIRRPIRLMESDATFVPVVWEMFRPTVLVPAGMAAWPRDRQSVVMVHELAHVKRRDCQLQLLAYAGLAFHWLNPLAWLAVRRLRIEREHACDDLVLRLGTRATDYAHHLLQITRGLLPASEPENAALAMARSCNLETRVAAILDPRTQRRLPDRRKTMIATALTLALLLPLAALQPGAQAEGSTLPLLPLGHAAPGGAHHATTPAHAPAAPLQDGEPTLDQLVQMRIHGVTPEFIDAVRNALGRPVAVRELVQMRIHGATPELLQEVRDVMPGEVEIGDVIQMRIHGASPEFAREMQELLGDDLTVGDLTQMRIHGVTAEFVREMRELLGDELTMGNMTQMRIHGASPEFVREMQELLDGEELTVGDVTQMRIHGVSTELVRELQEDGFNDLTVHDLVQMKIHGFDRWLRRRGGRN